MFDMGEMQRLAREKSRQKALRAVPKVNAASAIASWKAQTANPPPGSLKRQSFIGWIDDQHSHRVGGEEQIMSIQFHR